MTPSSLSSSSSLSLSSSSLSSLLQVIDNDENRICHIILEMFSRLPQNDSLKPYVPDLMSIVMRVIGDIDDNEDNAVMCLKLLFELHKTYRGMLEVQVLVRTHTSFLTFLTFLT